jgi:hypothetical protein
MARRLIDISVPLQNDVPADPPGNHPTIQYIDHQQGLPRMLQFFEGLKAADLPDGQGWAVEQVNLSTPLRRWSRNAGRGSWWDESASLALRHAKIGAAIHCLIATRLTQGGPRCRSAPRRPRHFTSEGLERPAPIC